MALKVGIIGCGGIATAHADTLKNLEEAELVAVTDVDAKRAEDFAAKYGATPYANHYELIDKADVQAVWICIPPFAHTDQELYAVEKGVPFFVEKPVALTMEKAREVEAAVEKAGLITGVGYLVRYMDAADKVLELIADKQVDFAEGYFMGGLPGASWWRRKELSGGQLVEQTTHIVDILRYFVGEVDTVAAFMALRGMQDVENMNTPNVGTVAMQFESGAVGAIHNTCMVKQGYKTGAVLIARDFLLEYTYTRVNWRTPDDSGEFSCEWTGMAREDRAFLQAVASGDTSQLKTSYADGVRTLAVTLAANLSAEERRKVKVSSIG